MVLVVSKVAPVDRAVVVVLAGTVVALVGTPRVVDVVVGIVAGASMVVCCSGVVVVSAGSPPAHEHTTKSDARTRTGGRIHRPPSGPIITPTGMLQLEEKVPAEPFANLWVSAIAVDEKGVVRIGTEAGLFRYGTSEQNGAK
jgi:hypothetical protein